MIENIKIEAKMEIKKISGLSCQDFIRNLLDIEERAELKVWRLRSKSWFRIILSPWRKEVYNAKD